MERTEKLLSGNEAVAQAAYEAGAVVGVGYPGTPSTETLEAFAKFEDVYAEWAPNEKVALEVAAGASLAGARCLVTMKHVGVNVAADPLYSISGTGVNGGLVILAADDPGMFSSQNEQDTRFHALGARIPLLEPSNPMEAHEFAKLAFDISEEFDIPVIVRSTVRLSHTKAMVACGAREERPLRPYEKDPSKWVMMPAFAKPRRRVADERVKQLAAYGAREELARAEMRETSVGIICSGVVYGHVREALPNASTLKLGMTYPMPREAIERFAESVDEVFVVEEASTYLSSQVASVGVKLAQTPVPIPPDGEISPQIIRRAFGAPEAEFEEYPGNLPPRPPMLCAGCPHRLVFAELARMGAVVNGDIGCYTLGTLPPLSAMDSCVDMGASLSMSHGMDLARTYGTGVDEKFAKRPLVGIIGDSTFAHSGITSLLGTVYNQGGGIACILDNRTTAMTGQQGNPVNGVTLQNRPSRELDLVKLCEALGVEHVQRVDPQDLKAVRAAFKEAREFEGLSVIVFCSPCQLLIREKKPAYVVSDECRKCRSCVKIGCPAIGTGAEGKAQIDPTQCIGCGQCAQICPFDCIAQVSDDAAAR
ncbi:MAG: thiamine pyrophosphate-dependent enzyme [Coriobacteriales bacterium]